LGSKDRGKGEKREFNKEKGAQVGAILLGEKCALLAGRMRPGEKKKKKKKKREGGGMLVGRGFIRGKRYVLGVQTRLRIGLGHAAMIGKGWSKRKPRRNGERYESV